MTVDLAIPAARARAANHRQLVVIAGDGDDAWNRLGAALARCPDLPDGRVAVGRDLPPLRGWETLPPDRVTTLLGRGPGLVVVDLHGSTEIDAMCVAAGAVRGNGLVVLLCPPLDAWADADDRLRTRLAPQPHEPVDVGRLFIERLADGLRRWAWVWHLSDEAAGPDEPDLPTPDAAPSPFEPAPPGDARFPADVYRACRTGDQVRAVSSLETLLEPPGGGPAAVVLSADRGRGKSSALGLAAHGLAASGARVIVTGPGPEATAEVRARAAELGDIAPEYVAPADVPAHRADVVLVDEAAALSVPVLRRLAAAAPQVAFATTVFGYEGTGMGFDVRFRADLVARDGSLTECRLDHPIRWAPGDPVEAWAREVFLLGARPGDVPFFHEVDPDEVTVEAIDADRLADDEDLLSQLLGLLTQAHHRTSPEDLARLLDGPDIEVRCALWRGSVVGALLLAHEGGLDIEVCGGLLEGRLRLRGNRLPEILTCHLAEEGAGTLDGWRVLRLAVHPAARRRGIGSRLLLTAVQEAPGADVDYVGAGFAATEDLLRFWNHCGFGVVRMAAARSSVSGEHSAMVLHPTTDWGERLAGRLQAAFVRRFPHVLADALSGLEPDVALAAMRGSLAREVHVKMKPDDWLVLLACAFGPAPYDTTVQPAWELTRAHLSEAEPRVEIDPVHQRLLMTRVIQHRPWAEAAAICGLDGEHEARQRLRQALRPLILAHGPAWTRREALRFGDEGGA